ncbi:MAG TPA: hypothetical protein VKG82_03785 [Solirubrobacteraceae bacterium]|nr:hypothetical protein [Solirubrobacteraceae bacterium]
MRPCESWHRRDPIRRTIPRRARVSTISAIVAALALSLAGGALAASTSARPPTKSERAAILKAFAANDANSSSVRGVYVSRSNANLAVVCERTPEAGSRAYVFGRSHGSWRYLVSGAPGGAGNSADRRLERACP